MNLSRLLYYCDYGFYDNQISNNQISNNQITNKAITSNLNNSYKDTSKFNKTTNKLILKETNYCILCNSEIKSHYIRDHTRDKDYYWCSNLCYKLYLNKKNKKQIKNE